MSDVQHFINGKPAPGASGRWGDVFNPATGERARRVALASAAEIDQAVRAARAAFPGWAATPPLSRARVMFKFRELLLRDEDDARPDHHRRARQGPVGRQGRTDPWDGGRRIRLRHPASDARRGHRAGRPRHRQLVGAPAGRRLRRHHAVQFPGDGADVDVSGGAGLRQHLRAETVGARPVGRVPHRRAAARSRSAARRVQCRPRRQGGGRRAAEPSRGRCGQLRRLDADRRIHLCDRGGGTESACRRWAAPRTTWW